MSAEAERYRQRQQQFADRARHCAPEFAVLWREVASSYQFLADHEEGLERERRTVAKKQNA